MEYYSAIQRNEVLVHDEGWALKTLCSGKITRHRRSYMAWSHVYEQISHRDWTQASGCQRLGRERTWDKVLNEYRALFWTDGMFWNWTEWWWHNIREWTKCCWTVHFKIFNFMLDESHLNTFCKKSKWQIFTTHPFGAVLQCWVD